MAANAESTTDPPIISKKWLGYASVAYWMVHALFCVFGIVVTAPNSEDHLFPVGDRIYPVDPLDLGCVLGLLLAVIGIQYGVSYSKRGKTTLYEVVGVFGFVVLVVVLTYRGIATILQLL
jgi:amino acid transporter